MPAPKVNNKIKREIVRLKQSGRTFAEIADELKLAVGTVKTHYYLNQGQPTAPQRIPESRYVRYDKPPTLEGDALILPDVEVPFHHAEFLNQVIDLADAWGIRQVICAGDLMHMDSISGWEPNWSVGTSKLTEQDEARLLAIALSLPASKRDALLEVVTRAGSDGKDFSDEMGQARQVLNALDACFEKFVWTCGNHEGRLLRAINSPVNPSELLNLMKLEQGKWEIAPYYYCILKSGGETFRITHPKSAADNAARALASQYHQHILMGHSHKMMFDWDASGKYAAVQMGHVVDEERLAYCAQRDARRNSHKLGAVIVRDGYIWLLNEHVDWNRLRSL